ncbi:response regulator [Paenibacillus terreus]|uniref:Response regulator n=1 Tax=Paenibacillus terreus TaxID=1387834 RepID=A0ABV5BEH8_9BACL
MYNILIVDDEPLICKGLSHLLNSSGLSIHQIFLAYSGHEALDVIRMEEIDLLVTDIQMGAMSGIDLMQQAKLAKPWMQTIIISAHETFQYAQMAIRMGAKDYLLKPIKDGQFLDSVRNALLQMVRPSEKKGEYLSLLNGFHMQEPDDARNKLLQQLLQGTDEKETTVNKLRTCYQTELAGPYFSVFKIRFDLPETRIGQALTTRDKNLIAYGVLNIACEVLQHDWSPVAFASDEQEISMIIPWSEVMYSDLSVSKINQLDTMGRSIHSHLDKYLGVQCVVGISQILKGIEFLSVLNHQAHKALLWNRAHKDHHVFYYGDFSGSVSEEPTEDELHEQNNRIVAKATKYIHENYAQKGLTLHEVAQKIHVSPNYLSYLFKKYTDCNLWEYVIKLRMEESKKLLLNTDLRRYEIADKVGYESPEHFSKIFKKYFGVSPSQIKK